MLTVICHSGHFFKYQIEKALELESMPLASEPIMEATLRL